MKLSTAIAHCTALARYCDHSPLSRLNPSDAEAIRTVLAALEKLSRPRDLLDSHSPAGMGGPNRNAGRRAGGDIICEHDTNGDGDCHLCHKKGGCFLRKQQSTRETLIALDAKIARGEKLTNAERLQRQGAIFGHSGKIDGPLVTTIRKTKTP